MASFGEIFFFPIMMMGRKSVSKKIDRRLIKKTRILSQENLSAIVFFKEHQESVCRRYLQKMDIKIKYELPLIRAYAVEIPASKLRKAAQSDIVRYISDDVKINSLLDIATQEVGARIANETGYTGRDIGIAVLDTGVYPHPDLTKKKNRIIGFCDFVNGKDAPYDDNGHGTFVAGVAAGDGYSSGGRYAGVASQANIIGVKVMDENGEGSSSDIIAGMQWVVDHRDDYNIKVMSLSLGSEASGVLRYDPLAVAASEVWKSGIVVVAAAGNSGPKQRTITTPGVSPAVITVGAVDDRRTVDIKDDVIATFSSRGPAVGRIPKPDVVAPGVDVVSLNADTGYLPGTRPHTLRKNYVTMSGTSVSTPMVAGIAALILEKYPDFTPDQVKEKIMNHARKIAKDRNAQGKGLVDVSWIAEV